MSQTSQQSKQKTGCGVDQGAELMATYGLKADFIPSSQQPAQMQEQQGVRSVNAPTSSGNFHTRQIAARQRI